jgi:hypothetical protein
VGHDPVHGEVVVRGVMVCKNGFASAELQNVVAKFLQIVEIADGNGPSLLWPEERFF